MNPARLTKAELVRQLRNAERKASRAQRLLDTHLRAAKKQKKAHANLRAQFQAHKELLGSLRASERQETLILRSLPMIVYTSEFSAKFGITWISENSRRITGFPSARFVRDPEFWASRLHPDDRDRVLHSFAATRATGSTAVEYRWQCADGTYHWFLDQAVLLRSKRNSPRSIIGIWFDISRRKLLEQEVLEISEREQRRIGQDLHDDLCQQLASIEFLSQALQRLLDPVAEGLGAHAAKIAKLVRKAISYTRELARGLSPVVVDDDGLMSALEQLAARTKKLYRLGCAFQCQAPVLIRDNSVATHLYRIAQEAVSNAIKHGKARQIEIALRQEGSRLVLSVLNDGEPLPENPASKAGIGLHTMKYRSGLIGGSLTVEPRNGAGTLVTCSLPNRWLKRSPSTRHANQT